MIFTHTLQFHFQFCMPTPNIAEKINMDSILNEMTLICHESIYTYITLKLTAPVVTALLNAELLNPYTLYEVMIYARSYDNAVLYWGIIWDFNTVASTI
jgi:hypothetical protein